jgi:hypothetical protein
MNKVSVFVLATGLLLLGGCASQSVAIEQSQQFADPKDPLESLNRSSLCGLYATNRAHGFTEHSRES